MKTSIRVSSLVLALIAGIGLATPVAAQSAPPGFSNRSAAVSRAAPGQTLTIPSNAAPIDIVAGYVRAKGASAATANSLRAVSQNRVATTGISHVRVEQQINGLPVYGAYAKAAISSRGELLHFIDALAPAPTAAVKAATVSEADALTAAMARVHPGEQVTFARGARTGNTTNFAGGAFFHSDPLVTRVVVPMSDGTMAQGFLVETWSEQGNQLHHTLVSGDGRVLNVEARTSNDRYNVFPEDPLKGPQTIVNGPGAGNVQSPAGWLGSGTQLTTNISGNNVNAYLDVDSNNRIDRGGTAVTNGDFLTFVDLAASPSTTNNRAVAVQNLFYLNNVVHDILYRHGFTEAAGNFQLDNFGLGGAGSDPVLAEAQDGGGVDNANFATPTDGKKPRMQMYLWSGVGPDHEVVVGTQVFGARGAEFGPKLTLAGITGAMLYAMDGCTSVSSTLRGKIALIDRGTCNFTTKVLNAQSAGAVGVIVVNNVGTNEIFTMGGTERRIKIPSVMVGHDDGLLLKALVGNTTTMRQSANPPLQLDGDLDSDIVFHEYGHGLTWRMIGGMSGPLAGAIGEGASDVLAFLINGDDRIGEYAYSNAGGIRRYPYQSYALTYAAVTGAEVHNDGEIYAAAMWKVYENYLAAGLTADHLLGDFVDGMNYTPSTPKFEDMRDGMLAAVNARNPERACYIWRGFANRGIGVGSSSTVSGSTVTITESFTIPAGCP